MSWFRLASFAIEEDLSRIHYFLDQRGIAHRFVEEDGQQILWLADRGSSENVLAFIEAWRKGELGRVTAESRGYSQRQIPQESFLRQAWQNTPLTLTFIALGIVGYLLPLWDKQLHYIEWLTFQGFTINQWGTVFHPLHKSLAQGEIWRLLTPTFLHFGALHIIFNGVIIWEFGRRLEIYLTRLKYCGLFLLVAIGANVVQYIFYKPSVFGGLSGVVYGYVGYLWMRQRLAPHPLLAIPKGIIVLLVLSLVLGFAGVIDLLISGKVANGAHLGGLIMGILGAYLFGSKHNTPGN